MHTKSAVRGVGILALALGTGCLPMRPPARSSGQVDSREGISLAISRQSCTSTSDPDQPGNDLVEERVELRVHNRSAEPLTLHRDAFRLVTPDGAALKTVSWCAAQPVAIAPGDESTFELRFMARAAIECGGEMRIAAAGALELRARPVPLQTIAFVPEGRL